MDNTYKHYLRCKHWQEIRLKVLDRSGGKCEKCGYIPWKPGTLQVHHLTYKNVGNESLDELIVLCPRCHMELHGIQGKRKLGFLGEGNVKKRENKKEGVGNV